MPRFSYASVEPRLPKYRRHRASGQAVVTLDGHDFYLGPHGTAVSRREYDRLIREYLAAGRCLPKPESEPIGPVDDATVQDTLPYLPPIVVDMVRFQQATGCRPAEVCMIRPMDVDTSGPTWIYTPRQHKTAWHGHKRIIFIGPRAQDVLRPYLLRPAESYCFSPMDGDRKRRAELHASRATPLSCGNRPGTNRKRNPRKRPGECYTARSYHGAVRRGRGGHAQDRVSRQPGSKEDDDA